MEKISVMLVDDHAIIRESIRKFLEEEPGFKVVGEAGDGETAIEKIGTLLPDILIMDIDMPGLNGIDATKKIKELFPQIAVLILTAYDYEQYIFPILEAGAAGYLLKDISGRDLVSAVKAISQGESILHPAVAGKVMQKFRSENQSGSRYPETLTKREKEVLLLASAGFKNKHIAQKLFVSVRTVEAHVGNVLAKLGAQSRAEAVLIALTKGLVNLGQLAKSRTL